MYMCIVKMKRQPDFTMSTVQSEKLVRKQYFVTPGNVEKLQRLASDRGTSAAEIVRLAIDAYESNGASELDALDLMELVSTRLKEAIRATKHTNRVVVRTLKALDQGQH